MGKAGVAMAQFPCLPIWTDAWVADTDHLNVEEEGMYFRLVRVMWRTPGCRVPNDDAWLIKHLRITPSDLDKVLKPLIFTFCQNDGNWITQKRLQREFVHRFEFSQNQSGRAKARWRKKKDDAGAHAGSMRARNATPSLNLNTKEETSLKRIDPALVLPTEKKQEPSKPARSLATAPDGGALTREPHSVPAEPKQGAGEKQAKPVSEMTLAEINAKARENGGLSTNWKPAHMRQSG